MPLIRISKKAHRTMKEERNKRKRAGERPIPTFESMVDELLEEKDEHDKSITWTENVVEIVLQKKKNDIRKTIWIIYEGYWNV